MLSVPTEDTSADDVTRWLRDSRRFDAGILAKFKGVDGMMLRACTLEDFVTETGLAPLAARGLYVVPAACCLHPRPQPRSCWGLCPARPAPPVLSNRAAKPCAHGSPPAAVISRPCAHLLTLVLVRE